MLLGRVFLVVRLGFPFCLEVILDLVSSLELIMASSHKNSTNKNEKHHIDILDLNKEMTEDLEEAIEWEDDEVDDEEARFELSLAGKIWTNRNINASVFISIMKNV